MPTYEYACKDCQEHLEVQQSFTDDALTVCPSCDGPLRKVFGNIAITFKGSGFYKTDSRSSSTANGKGSDAKADAKSGDTTSESSKSESSSSGTSESSATDTKKSETKTPDKKKADAKSSTPAAAAS
ncbi:MAG: zinc ribbon domain-containing protein [Acidimicrobiales bacterium]